MTTTTTRREGAPTWCDFGTGDIPRLAAFLSGVFGWRAEADPALGGYTTLWHADAAVCGIGPAFEGDPHATTTVSLAADEVDQVAARAQQAGASLLVEPMTVGRNGRTAVLGLPGGQHVALWQAEEQQGFGAMDTPGAPCWFELVTPERDATEDLLRTVFGYRFTDGPDASRVAALDGQPLFMLFATNPRLPHGWSAHFQVDDLDAARARCLDLGGRAIEEEADTMGDMRYAALTSPDGAVFWLMQRD